VQSKIAAGIVTLQNPICKFLTYIVTKMLEKMQDKHSSKLRSRGMTGLEQLIQKDPRVITRENVKYMAACFADVSPMVRESTLSLVATCLEHQPTLLPDFFGYILQLANDPSNGPKKKAIKLLREIYNGPSSMEQKLHIIISLLPASQDAEKAISELARNVLEEIMLSTKSTAKADDSKLKLDRTKRAKLIIDTTQIIHGDPKQLEAFEKFFIYVLSGEAKADDTNIHVCKDLVADMIDEVISPRSGSDTVAQARTMTALSIFAKVRPTLFTIDQIQLLKLYIKVVVTADDLLLVQPTVVIFRHVFPILDSLQATFAEEVRASLISNVPKLAQWAIARTKSRDTLVDVAHCLWTISPMADQGIQRLLATITSVLCQLRPLTLCTQQEAGQNRVKIESYLIILGIFGQVCSLDQYAQEFLQRLRLQASQLAKKLAQPKDLDSFLKATSAPSLLLLETVRPFTTQGWEMDVRVQALRSVGGICQGSPSLFMRAEIEKIYKLVFVNSDNDELRRVALDAFRGYFTFAERRSETGAEIAVGKGAVTGNARLETSFVANENDTATLHIAQKFLQNFVQNALENNNDLAVSATRIIASISRQGLVHPKECGAALVALSTSSNEIIAQTASTEHKRIHEKQESYLEKEYMQAVTMAFHYQVKVFGDSHGMRETNYSAKLGRLFEALKSGKKATFKKFVGNICKKIDFNFPKLDVSGDMPDSVLLARFCLENLALLDFALLEEVAICLNALEAIVLKNTGSTVALAIESEMPKQWLKVKPPHDDSQPPPQLYHQMGVTTEVQAPVQVPESRLWPLKISDARLRHITVACMILKMIWETRTFIRRCYSLQKLRGSVPQKDYAKPTQRNNFVSGKELWDTLTPTMDALNDRESMIKTCYEFADILNVDSEVQVDEDEDGDELGAGYETPTEGDTSMPVPTSGRGRKRKSNMSLSNTPKKARGRPTSTKNKKRTSRTPDFDDDDSD
jgi:cohesin loading factor subunit SCC2